MILSSDRHVLPIDLKFKCAFYTFLNEKEKANGMIPLQKGQLWNQFLNKHTEKQKRKRI